MRFVPAFALAVATLAALPAGAADRRQVFSLQKLDCASCAAEIEASLKGVHGYRRMEFDRRKAEMTVWLAEGVGDDAVLAAVDRVGFAAVVGPGKGAWLSGEPWPAGADVKYLTRDGSAVGKLSRHRVAGKFTVFDIYADWCLPCRDVDAHLRKIVAARPDVAVRKLNIVDFESPLGLELGDAVQGLPYLVVYSPAGKRTDITGLNPARLDKALAR